jgi:hypothetical protein
MHSQDLQDQNNNRADAINGLITYCMDNNLSYNYTDKTFTVTLPTSEPLPMATELTPKEHRRDKFNIDTWGPKGYVEGEEPDPQLPLDEGEPPRPQL